MPADAFRNLSGKKVLLIQTAFPGDVLFCLPLAVALKAREPSLRLVGLTSREAAEVWGGQPCFDEIVVWDKRGKEGNQVDMIRLVRRLRRSPPDIAIVAHTSMASALLARFSGAGERIGFRKGPFSFLHTRRLAFPEDTFEGRYRGVFDLLGLTPPSAGMVFKVDEGARARVRAILSDRGWFDAKRRIAVTFGSKIPTKKWPAEKWAVLLKQLSGEASTKIILLGTAGESEEAERIRSGAPNQTVNLTGLSVAESAAALQSSTLAIGVDSFGLHLARFLGVPATEGAVPRPSGRPGRSATEGGVPCVGIFGPTDPKALDWLPNQKPVFLDGLPCRPCTVFHAPRHCPKGHHDCMNRLPPESVVETVRRFL